VSEVVDGPAVAGAARGATVGYVVQERVMALAPGQNGEPVEMWRDIATVEVSRRTKRRTVVERALSDSSAGIDASGTALLRVLSPGDSKTFRVSTVQRDPELRIEGV
jgi:hypothetical protein